jgi:hypothetical protein
MAMLLDYNFASALHAFALATFALSFALSFALAITLTKSQIQQVRTKFRS